MARYLSFRCPPIVNISMSTGKFEDDSAANTSIKNFFSQSTMPQSLEGASPSQRTHSQVRKPKAKKRKVGPIQGYFSTQEKENYTQASATVSIPAECESTQLPVTVPVLVDSEDSQDYTIDSDYQLALKLQKEISQSLETTNIDSGLKHIEEKGKCSKPKTGFFAKVEKMNGLKNGSHLFMSGNSSDADDFEQPRKKVRRSGFESEQDDVRTSTIAESIVKDSFQDNGEVKSNFDLSIEDILEPDTSNASYDEEISDTASKLLSVPKTHRSILNHESHIENNHKEGPSTSSNTDNVSEHSPSNYSAEDYVKCEKCGKMVVVWEMPEHADYHFALELQKQVSQTPVAASSQTNSTPKSLPQKSTRGRKKKILTSGSKSPSVLNFFSKKE